MLILKHVTYTIGFIGHLLFYFKFWLIGNFVDPVMFLLLK